MTPAERVRELFDRATELPLGEREAFLVEHCAGDPALLDECRQLLVAYERAIERELPTTGEPQEGSAPSTARTFAPVLAPGRLFGDYRIVRIIGRGGMGEVYEAEHVEHGRRIALKVMLQSKDSPRERQRFLDEGRLAASIAHPNSVYVFGTEEIEGRQIIAMELLTGGTLRDRVAARGPLPVHEAVGAMLDVIAGLAAAAEKGVLHRDVKPSNCFVDRLGRVKIGDYGLSISSGAREGGALTDIGLILGTPGFSSPEQLQGERLDVRSDIYSVGGTLFYLLTGRVPFDDPNIVRLVAKVTRDRPPSPRQFQSSIPQGLATIVLKCLEKDALRRFQTYRELEDSLRAYVRQQQVASPVARLFAGAVDLAILAIVIRVCEAVFWSERWSVAAAIAWPIGLGAAIGVAYFTWFERSGSSPGKRLFGLRVERMDAGAPAGWRTWCRAVIFVGACWIVPSGVLYGHRITSLARQAEAGAVENVVVSSESVTMSGRTFPRPRTKIKVTVLSGWHVVGLVLLFCTAWPARRYRGIHELLSGTVTRSESLSTEHLAVSARSAGGTAPRDGASVGPYLLSRESSALRQEQRWIRAYDPLLDRPVWLQFARRGAEPLSVARRELNRPMRPRWLAGKHNADESWDAFEFVDGLTLADAMASRPAMRLVQGWLADLANEIRAGIDDATNTNLAVGHLWVTHDGRLQILDAAPEGTKADASGTPATLESVRVFLCEVAERLLRGSSRPDNAPPHAPLPATAGSLMRSLETRRFGSFDEIARAFDRLRSRDFTLGHTRRAAPALGLAVALLVVAQGPFTRMFEVNRQMMAFETNGLLSQCLGAQLNLSKGHTTDVPGWAPGAEQRCIASLSTLLDRGMLARWRVDAVNRRLIDDALARYPSASLRESLPDMPPRMRSRARFVLGPLNDTAKHFATTYTLMAVRRTIWIGSALALIIVITLGYEPVLASLGIVVVRNDGTTPERWRKAARTALVWAPLVAASLLTLLTCPKPDPPWIHFGSMRVMFAFSPLLLAAGTAAYSIRNPTRGLAERLTGTWLVRS